MIGNINYIIKKFFRSPSVGEKLIMFISVVLGAVDLVSTAFLAIITSIVIDSQNINDASIFIIIIIFVYLIVRLVSFKLTKRIERKSFCFRSDEISNIASKVLRTDYEKLQDAGEQSLIEGAYYAVFSGGNAGLEYEINQLYQFSISTIGFLLLFVPGIVLFPMEVMVIILCNILLLVFLNQKTKIDSVLAKEINKTRADARNVLKQIVNKPNVSDIYLYKIHHLLLKKYHERNGKKFREENRQYLKTLFLVFIMIVINTFVFVYSLHAIQTAENIGGVVAYFYLLINLTTLSKKMYSHMINISNNNNSVEQWRVYDESFADLQVKESTITNIDSIKFVDIGYVVNSVTILKNISLELTKGEKVAFVGKNGAGKTTLAKIVLGVLHPTEGQIYVNGAPVSYEEYSTLIFNYGYTPQENSIFAFDVATNIVMNEYAKSKHQSALYGVLNKSGLSAVVDKLKDKEKTHVGRELKEDGVDFSGGEKRKLLLARSLFHKRNVNIYDEPTSSLDSKSEREFYGQISSENTSISIFVSHRIGTTNFCDRVYVIDEGRIAQCGQGDHLIKEYGVYRELFESQVIQEEM